MSVDMTERAAADELPDIARMQKDRLARLREEMSVLDCAACILVDPVNVRYASGARSMQVFMSRNPARYLFVPLEGPVVLFEFEGCHHLAHDLETIDEIRPAKTVSFVAAGPNVDSVAEAWSKELAQLIRDHCGNDARVGIERVNHHAAAELARRGIRIMDAQQPVERARARKTADEVKALCRSLRLTEQAVGAVREAIAPGESENEIWSHLHKEVIAGDGEYVETRLLASGSRTNPWFQECSGRIVGTGDLVALDTDVVGCYGYYADFSRTFLCGDRAPSGHQRSLYRLAYEQVCHNIDLLRPGVTFREYSETAWTIPEKYFANRYYLSAHGVGMTGEYPYLYHRADYAGAGYDGVLEAGMTICVESYIGEDGGFEGVKLEQQVLITDSGPLVLSRFPFDRHLLGREI